MILQKTNISYNKINSDLYLGSWCIDLIENILKNKIHKYHWSNLEKFDEDSKLIFKYYDFFIMELTSILNLNNNENKNYKYWQRIIGPWLLYFISVVFDRYENLKSLKNKSEIITYIPKYDKNDWVPLDFIDFEDMISRDDWNLYIYSEIIKITNIINYKILENNLVNKKYRRKKIHY